MRRRSRDCTNEAEVKFVQANAAGAGYLCIGGIAGQTYSGAKVTGCANRAAVSSDKLQVTRIGGIVGTHNASTIDDCSNSGDITLAYTATANNWGGPQAASWVSTTARTARR